MQIRVVCQQLLKSNQLSEVMEAGLKRLVGRADGHLVPCGAMYRASSGVEVKLPDNKTSLLPQNSHSPRPDNLSRGPYPYSASLGKRSKSLVITGSGRKHIQTYIVIFGRLSAVWGFLRRND
jgi:hypothetical protein